MDATLVVKHIIAGFFFVDADWVVRASNPRASTLLRRPARELEGKTLWDAFPGLAGTNAEIELRAAIGSRIERRFECFSPSLYNWFELWVVSSPANELYLFFQDVSDRARSMQSDALREALRRVLMDAPVAISITRGPDHRYDLMNAAARALIGGRNLEGMTARNAMPEVDASLFESVDQVYHDGTPLTLKGLDIEYDREGGGTLYRGTFDVVYQPMRGSDGSIEGIIQTAVETTRLEE